MSDFSDVASPNPSEETKAKLREAMQKSCDEQSRLMDWEPDYDYEIRKCNKTPEELVNLLKKRVR